MFKKMEYVYAIYKEGSFTKAAQRLYISQPCLSAAVKKLEEEIGMPLFERRYSSLRLTKIGLEYIEAAEKIMNIRQGFIDRINDINNIEYGSITVGGSNYVSSYILPRIISRFSELYPKIEITLVEANSVELENKLRNEEVDLVIDNFDEDNISYRCTPLMDEKILLAVPELAECNKGLEAYRINPESIYKTDFDICSVPEISVKHFEKEKFILLKKGNNMYEKAMQVFKTENVFPDVSFRLDQLSTSYRLAASGNGVCFVTDTIFKYHDFKDGVILYNVKGGGKRTLYIAGKRNRSFSNAVNRFIETAQEL